MSLPIITADQRLAERRGVKGVLVGKSGIGKTSQLWTLKPTATLFFDLEAGDLASRAGRATRSVRAPGRSVVTSRCTSAGRTGAARRPAVQPSPLRCRVRALR